MLISRRMLLQSGIASACATAMPSLLSAELNMGSATLTTVSDGNLVLPGSFIFEPMPQDALQPILAEFGQSATELKPECNLALFRDGTRTVLFDVGSGPDFAPTAGSIVDSLAALDLAPEDVTDVVFTHAHPDHIWGLLDDFDDLLFADAQYHMGAQEWEYWWDPDTVNTIGDARAAFAVGAKRRMEAIADRVQLCQDGQEILPGIAALASPGHTPGHMAYEINTGGAAALVVGDAIGNHHVAFRRPEWASGSDQDQTQAIAARTRLLDRLYSENMNIVGFHLPSGGMGHVDKDSGGYRFVPA